MYNLIPVIPIFQWLYGYKQFYKHLSEIQRRGLCPSDSTSECEGTIRYCLCNLWINKKIRESLEYTLIRSYHCYTLSKDPLHFLQEIQLCLYFFDLIIHFSLHHGFLLFFRDILPPAPAAMHTRFFQSFFMSHIYHIFYVYRIETDLYAIVSDIIYMFQQLKLYL